MPRLLPILLCLTLTACTATPPITSNPLPPEDIIELRQLQYSDPHQLATTLQTVLPITVAVDDRTTTLILKGLPNDVARAINLIDKLEAVTGPDLDPQVFFFRHLKNARARDLLPFLQNVVATGLLSVDRQKFAPSFFADERLNALFVRVDRVYEERVRNLIDELDRSLTPSTQPQPEIRIERGTLTP